MHIYDKHDIEVPNSTYNQWIQYRKGFKNVRVKRLEEVNFILCYGNDIVSYIKVSYTIPYYTVYNTVYGIAYGM